MSLSQPLLGYLYHYAEASCRSFQWISFGQTRRIAATMLRCSPFCTYRLRLEDAVCIDRQSLIRCIYCLLLQDLFFLVCIAPYRGEKHELRLDHNDSSGVRSGCTAPTEYSYSCTPSTPSTPSTNTEYSRGSTIPEFTDTRCYSEYFISDLYTTNKELYGLQYAYILADRLRGGRANFVVDLRVSILFFHICNCFRSSNPAKNVSVTSKKWSHYL